MYISRTKKKGKKGKKRKKKITVAFPPAIPSVIAYFLEFGTEDRPLLLFQSWLLLGLSWTCIFLAIIVFESMYFLCSTTKYMFYLLKNGEKTLNSSNASKTWFVLFSRSVLSNSLCSHGLQHVRLPCPSLSPGACSNSCPLDCTYWEVLSWFPMFRVK